MYILCLLVEIHYLSSPAMTDSDSIHKPIHQDQSLQPHINHTINNHLTQIQKQYHNQLQTLLLKHTQKQQQHSKISSQKNIHNPKITPTRIQDNRKTQEAASKIAIWKIQKKEKELLKKMFEDIERNKKQQQQRRQKQEAEQKAVKLKQIKKIQSMNNLRILQEKQAQRINNASLPKISISDESHKKYEDFLTTDVTKRKSQQQYVTFVKKQRPKVNVLTNLFKQSRKEQKQRLRKISQFNHKLQEIKVPISKQKRYQSQLRIDKQLNSSRYKFKSSDKAAEKLIFQMNNPEEFGAKLKRHSINFLQKQKQRQKQTLIERKLSHGEIISHEKPAYQNYIPFNIKNARKEDDIQHLIKNPVKQNLNDLFEKGYDLEEKVVQKLKESNQFQTYQEMINFQKDIDNLFVKAIKAKLASTLVPQTLKRKITIKASK